MRKDPPYLVAAAATCLLAAGLIYGHTSSALQDQGVTLTQASNYGIQTSTFSLSGVVASLAFSGNDTYMIEGNWSMSVNNGNITSFNSNITAISIDGQKTIPLQISNYTARTKLFLNVDNALAGFGTADVASSNMTVNSVPIALSIANMKVITIVMVPQGPGNFVAGQPIYGSANTSQTTQLASAPAPPKANGDAQLRNSTPSIGIPGLPNPFIG